MTNGRGVDIKHQRVMKLSLATAAAKYFAAEAWEQLKPSANNEIANKDVIRYVANL